MKSIFRLVWSFCIGALFNSYVLITIGSKNGEKLRHSFFRISSGKSKNILKCQWELISVMDIQIIVVVIYPNVTWQIENTCKVTFRKMTLIIIQQNFWYAWPQLPRSGSHTIKDYSSYIVGDLLFLRIRFRHMFLTFLKKYLHHIHETYSNFVIYYILACPRLV